MKYLLGEKLNFDWKIVTVTIVSTLLLMVDHYHKLTAHKYWDRVILVSRHSTFDHHDFVP